MMKKLKQQYKKYPVTMLLITICIFVYCISFICFGEEMTVSEGIQFGGYNPVIVSVFGQYYRIITSNFIHFGLMHLVVNCYSLYGIGVFIESFLNSKKYLFVCCVSLLTTSGIPYILYLLNGFGSDTLSGGISGMIFGLVGCLAALACGYGSIFKQVFKQLALNIMIILFVSLIIPSISLSGHVCGMIGGFISMYLLIIIQNNKQNKSNLVN